MATLAAVLVSTIGSMASGQALPDDDFPGTPIFMSVPGDKPDPSARTIPYWTFDATDPTNGITYPLTMVGSDPSLGAPTVIPTVIIPIRLNFADGSTLDATDRVAAVTRSPIFSEYGYPSGMAPEGTTGQYGDVLMRAQFNQFGTDYHVILGAPTVLPTVVIDVPQHQGLTKLRKRNILAGLVDNVWFGARLQNLLGELHLDPTTLPIFLTNDVMLYFANDPAQCCGIGFHGSSKAVGGAGFPANTYGASPIQTYVWATYFAAGSSRPGARTNIDDIHILSHELAEWLDDPFDRNAVQPWQTPTASAYGCTPLLETGDPLVGVWFPLAGSPDPSPYAGGLWHPEDEVFWPRFLRQPSSPAYGGNDTFMGPLNPYPAFHTIATNCN
jgi:hypothetical protein